MTEELVTFETAKLAKEKGFDILKQLIGSHHTFYKSDGSKIVGDSFAKQLMSYVPTQSLLQKWLREVHNIYVEIRLENSKDSIRFYVVIWGNPKGNHNTSSYTPDHMYDKYEIALETGLLQALNLIK